MSGRVVHVNDNIEGAVYVGRANGRKGLAASPFANPFRLPKNATISQRRVVIFRYNDWLLDQPGLIRRLRELRGKPLACWCRHDGEERSGENECHADILIDLLNDYTDWELEQLVSS